MFRVFTLAIAASVADALPRILCLHGGGGNGFDFQREISSLVTSMSDQYEFHFPSAPAGVWVRDPPGGKGQPTTDPDWGASSVAYLDAYVQANGPFHGIMGYSQGSMFTAYYLSVVPANTFQMAMMFCGYLPETHLGLLNTINAASPFNSIPALVFMGANDGVISNSLTQGQAAKFTSPVVLTSSAGGHYVPGPSDPTYSSMLSFMYDNAPAGTPFGPIAPTSAPADSNDYGNDDEEDSDKEDFDKEDCDDYYDEEDFDKEDYGDYGNYGKDDHDKDGYGKDDYGKDDYNDHGKDDYGNHGKEDLDKEDYGDYGNMYGNNGNYGKDYGNHGKDDYGYGKEDYGNYGNTYGNYGKENLDKEDYGNYHGNYGTEDHDNGKENYGYYGNYGKEVREVQDEPVQNEPRGRWTGVVPQPPHTRSEWLPAAPRASRSHSTRGRLGKYGFRP